MPPDLTYKKISDIPASELPTLTSRPESRTGCADLRHQTAGLSSRPPLLGATRIVAVQHVKQYLALGLICKPSGSAYLVEHACNGHGCKVYGWYAGGHKLYLDQRMDPEKDLLAASVIVHEMVHYLQGVARHEGVPGTGAAFGERPFCTEAIEMEREAYAAQREFLLRYGVYQPVGVSMLRVGCEG